MRRSRAALAAIAFLTITGSALAGDIVVPMDEARIVTFSRPVTTLFVANPFVADVNAIDSTHAFVLGKAFGSTNLIALDAERNQVSNSHVTVFGGHALVTLNRGSSQFTFACMRARCETFSAPGDQKTYYDDSMNEVDKREQLGNNAASPSGH